MPDLDLVFVVDTENVEVSEATDAVLQVVEDSTLSEFVAIPESLIVVQTGEWLPVINEQVSLAETTNAVLLVVDAPTTEVLDLTENVVVNIVSEPDASITHPGDDVPPAEVTDPVLPDISAAFYQEDGLVRVYHIDETEATTAYDDTTLQGRQLIQWVEDGGVIVPFTAPPVTGYQVDQEKDRRIARGIMVTLDSTRQIAVQTRTLEDFRNVTYLVTTAAATPIDQFLRDAYNIVQTLSAAEMIELGAKLTGLVQEYYESAWALKDMSEIASDYQDDSHWPDHSYPPEPPPGYV